ncbi:hypothetical protein HDU84_008748 [Entophlyctis sp. JEL0112]|nr:hypothetical protein HDU84_008748 [Entophlyctis sp. JEL0112]
MSCVVNVSSGSKVRECVDRVLAALADADSAGGNAVKTGDEPAERVLRADLTHLLQGARATIRAREKAISKAITIAEISKRALDGAAGAAGKVVQETSIFYASADTEEASDATLTAPVRSAAFEEHARDDDDDDGDLPAKRQRQQPVTEMVHAVHLAARCPRSDGSLNRSAALALIQVRMHLREKAQSQIPLKLRN